MYNERSTAFQRFVNGVVECGLCTAADLVELGMRYGEREAEFVDEVCEWAHAARHSKIGAGQHTVVVAYADHFWKCRLEAEAKAKAA